MTGNPEAIPGQKSSCGSFTRLSKDKRASGDQPIAKEKPTYQDLCDPTASDSFRFADNAEEIVG